MFCRIQVLCLALSLLLGCSAFSDSPVTLEEIAAGHVGVVDLSYPLNKSTPHWPGEGHNPFFSKVIATLEQDGVYSGAFSTPEHLGTHIDAPNHFEKGQSAVHEIKLKSLISPIAVIDVRRACNEDSDYELSVSDLKVWEKQYGAIPMGSVVFAWTGWGQRWSSFDRYKNQDSKGQLHFPGFSPAAARFLVERRAVKGIGIDTLSVDRGLAKDFLVHHILGAAGAYQIENAANLGQVPTRGSWLIVAPIKIENGSGGPARVWAVLPR